MFSNTGNRELLHIIQRMAYMAEYREGNNQAHIERIRGYSYNLALASGLAHNDAEVISFASVLHDVGKVFISDEIAKKTDNLDPQEWEMIEKHTEIGAEILNDYTSPVFQTGRIIALTHHERWDGSGYPQGLKGEDIALSGRIVAIADVFDALTTKRPYKDEISPEDALNLIIDSRGKLFDPDIVDLFEEDFTKILRVKNSV